MVSTIRNIEVSVNHGLIYTRLYGHVFAVSVRIIAKSAFQGVRNKGSTIVSFLHNCRYIQWCREDFCFGEGVDQGSH